MLRDGIYKLFSRNIDQTLKRGVKEFTQPIYKIPSKKMEIADIEETIKRIQSHKGVQGIIITNKEGGIIRTTMDNTSALQYISGILPIQDRSSSFVRDIDATNELIFLRLRSKKFEIMITTGDDYIAIVIQNPNEN